MYARTTALAGALAVWACGPGPVGAQVTRTQDGRILDANTRVGSSGVNTPVRSAPRPGSQLYVDGRVTGLGGFRGRVGYLPSDSLRLRVPSAGLSRFDRESVGLQGVLGGSTYRSSPYYSRTDTVFGAGAIAAGRTPPGSNIPRTSTGSSPLTGRLYDDVRAQYAPLLPAGAGARLPPMPGGLTGPQPGLDDDGRRLAGVGGLRRPGAAQLFSFPREDQPQRPADRHAIDRGRDETDQQAEGAREPFPGALRQPSSQAKPPGLLADSARPAKPGREADRAATPGGDLTGGAPTGPGRSGLEPSSRRPGRLPGTTGREDDADDSQPGQRGRAPVRLPDRDQDVFVDLLVSLKQKRTGAAHVPGDKIKPARPRKWVPTLSPRAPGAEADRRTETTPDMPVSDWRTGRRRLDYSQPKGKGEQDRSETPEARYVELTQDRKILINSLAGRGRDQLNRRLAAAQKKLRAGRYYDAAAEFELAAAVDPRNPLARVGGCLAMFFAGEPLSAANYLRQAMQDFPPLMEARFNLTRLVQPKTVRWQIDRLKRSLASASQSSRPMLTFLATFIHLCAGDDAAAKSHARRLRLLAGPDKLLRAYADYVLTGRLPASSDKANGGE